jgi:ATP-dependent metalloprotease
MCVSSLVDCLCLPQTYFLPDDSGYKTRAQLLATLDVAMGGRVAEEMTLGAENVTTGAGSDMANATAIARQFCQAYSMSDLGLASYAKVEPSSATQAAIDREVDRLLAVRWRRV